jgi:hypothetical protein
MTVDKMTIYKINLECRHYYKMTVNKMTINKMTLDSMNVNMNTK